MSLQISFMSFRYVFGILRITDDFISLRYLTINLSKFILNITVDLLILNCFTISMNFSFSLNLLNTLPCSYAMRMIFLFFVRIISSYSLMMVTASWDFSTLFAILYKFVDSTFWLSINGLSNLISSLLSIFFLVALPASPFRNYIRILNLSKHFFYKEKHFFLFT